MALTNCRRVTRLHCSFIAAVDYKPGCGNGQCQSPCAGVFSYRPLRRTTPDQVSAATQITKRIPKKTSITTTTTSLRPIPCCCCFGTGTAPWWELRCRLRRRFTRTRERSEWGLSSGSGMEMGKNGSSSVDFKSASLLFFFLCRAGKRPPEVMDQLKQGSNLKTVDKGGMRYVFTK